MSSDPALTLPLLTNESGDAVFLAKVTERDINAASFLDERLLGTGIKGHWAPQRDAQVAANGLVEGLDYVFHIGHVGSTLLSRLIGRLPSVLSLREPAALRPLALSTGRTGEEPFQSFVRLWSQTFRPGQRTVLKATSFVSEISAALLERTGAPKAVFLTAAPAAYLATILGAENSPAEARRLAPLRADRLHARLGTVAWQVSRLSDGEIAAMSWASEMCALAEAWAAHGPQAILWLDFDRLLAEPRETLAAVMTHLRGGVSDDDLALVLSSPDFNRYSKAPEHAYDANLRRAVMAQAQRDHGEAMRQGIVWFESAATRFPVIRNALEIWRKTASISRQGHGPA